MTTITADAPLLSDPMPLRPEWIDLNGHLNMAFYGVLFDEGCSHVFRRIGFGSAYRRETNHTTFTGDFHIRYLREVKPGTEVRVSFQMLDVGTKAFHFCQTMLHPDGWIAATAESISLHIDQSGPRVAPYPPEMADRLAALLAEHADLPRPDWVGGRMGVRS